MDTTFLFNLQKTIIYFPSEYRMGVSIQGVLVCSAVYFSGVTTVSTIEDRKAILEE